MSHVPSSRIVRILASSPRSATILAEFRSPLQPPSDGAQLRRDRLGDAAQPPLRIAQPPSCAMPFWRRATITRRDALLTFTLASSHSISAMKNSDSFAKGVDSFARGVDSFARDADSFAKGTDSFARDIDFPLGDSVRGIPFERVVILHGYGATPADHWFPWLTRAVPGAEAVELARGGLVDPRSNRRNRPPVAEDGRRHPQPRRPCRAARDPTPRQTRRRAGPSTRRRILRRAARRTRRRRALRLRTSACRGRRRRPLHTLAAA